MVYCGKPSGGCSVCRGRKIRCDQKDPSCTQCTKKGIACPGYRNLVDLMFRDESSHVIKKAESRRSQHLVPNQKSSAGQGLPSPSPSPLTPAEPIGSSPAFIIDSRPGGGLPPASKVEKPNKATDRRSRKRATRCRAPVLSALNNDWSRSSSETSESPTNANDDGGASELDVPLDRALSPETQDKGISFFFSRYVTTNGGSHQNYSFIYDVWKPPDSAQSQVDLVSVSMAAVGLAACSQSLQSPELMTRAQESYAIALGLTHRALRDPIEVVKDTTMLAVLILGTYEFVSGYSAHTMRAWQDHVNGAAALAGIRGVAQFRTKAGARMFLMLCQTVLISCIQSGLPMPGTLIDLRRQIPPSEELMGPDFHVTYPVYKALQVRHDIKSGTLSSLDVIVNAISNVQEEISATLSGLPEDWRYHNVQLTQPDPRVLGQTCHVYTGLLQSTTWNMVRGIRMLLLETFVEKFCAIFESSSDTAISEAHLQILAISVKLLNMLGRSIAASIPQHLGVVSIRDIIDRKDPAHTVSIAAKKQAYRVLPTPPAHDTRFGTGDDASSSGGSPVMFDPTRSKAHTDDAARFVSLASTNSTIIWPLYMLGMSSVCSSETKQYAVEGLNAIHREAGLEQARVVAGLLQEQKAGHSICNSSLLSKLPSVAPSTLPSIV
ncbi:hypothetical protein FVEN_g8014 [Fusarium venenatum]|uniref:Zn(2)-C6 fungal-type domain-containing protein n=1 Tax=Fusarium venenatum TaxID=56646 RepID=A0A2L2TFL1_9HYPO|nr:uncharacterized protein FVRRES_08836 [Fusarium venenatum]KAG8354053.1 hypothetical protein FVEN_g8014 [Fusarium venenatum]CEI68759.1 unnamed protein product [Fusarium venenatum]